MKFLKRLVYLAYYVRRMNWSTLRRFMAFTKTRDGTSYIYQSLAMLGCSLKYNISPLEYYQFRFSKLTPEARATWAGTGTMYEYQLKCNPPDSRQLLRDKRKFYRAYQKFFRHQMFTIQELQSDPSVARELLSQHEKLVFKSAEGNCGIGVKVVPSKTFTSDSVLSFMEKNQFDLVETFAKQHPALDALSPSAVNTVRIFTKLDDNNRCVILGCRLRISVNSQVDNMAAGNLAAPVDQETGIVNGPGVYSDITKQPQNIHPITNVPLVGFQIPFWKETLEMVDEASRLYPQNRSIGWDIVVTADGPGLIEGNHDWCKLVWQLPVGKGLRHLLQ